MKNIERFAKIMKYIIQKNFDAWGGLVIPIVIILIIILLLSI